MPFFEFLEALRGSLLFALKGPALFVLGLWWVWLPIPLVVRAWRSWLRYARLWYYWVREEWILLEVRVPKEILKTPKAMEQIFSGVWSIITTGNKYERFWLGRWIDYMSFELLGSGGETHFFICLPERYRPMIESYIYSEYPEAEIEQVPDYFDSLPEEFPREDWRIMGSELAFVAPDAYPIRTYLAFEDPTDERRIDPMSHFAELFGRLRQGEYVIYQLVIRPAQDKDWKPASAALVNRLIGKVLPKPPGAPELKESRAWLRDFGAYVSQFFFGGEVTAEEEKEDARNGVGTSKMLHLSPGERFAVEAVGMKTGKHGLEVNFRMVYVGKPELFRAKPIVSAMFGATGLFGGELNGFRPHNPTKTWVDYFKKRREPKREKRLWHEMRKRLLVDRLFASFFAGKYFGRPSGVLIMNIEELASIYHFPIKEVAAPMLPRIEAKRGEPPVGLPVG